MNKYVKKPVVIEAVQWDGTFKDLQRIEREFGVTTMALSKQYDQVVKWCIPTLEGSHIVSPNDFIIKGVKGEFYPCKPDIFEMTYAPYDPQEKTE